MTPHNNSIESVLKHWNVSPQKGLSEQEAKERVEQYGINELEQKKKKSIIVKFLEQFKDVMILILLTAAAVSFGIEIYNRFNNPAHSEGFFEPLLIVLIVVLNAVMGVAQENKAEKALEALKSLSAPKTKVIREAKEKILPSDQLVPGDIIKLEAGDFIPADARLIESFSLQSEESALTGESVPSEKDAGFIASENAPLGDRKNMVYSGCSVSYGRGLAVVTATGMKTEMGRIANLLNEETDPQTPLQSKLARLGKYLGIAALAACAIIFIIGLIDKMDVMQLFMTSVSLAVSAIPEGLPAIVTIVLAIGVQRMVKRNAIIRRLPAVETLGSASVICSDKTGTLTQNRMTLVKAFLAETGQVVSNINTNDEHLNRLLTYATLCCDGTVEKDASGTVKHIGDPTETAIVYAAYQNGIYKDVISKSYPREAELPFDSDRKLMSTVHKIDTGYLVVVKGAVDILISRCITGDMEMVKATTDSMAEDALRVLAVAYKILPELPKEITSDVLERDLTFLGLVGMIDPPRPEAKKAVSICRKAGIRPVMITGDHVITAAAIAKQLGIFQEGDTAVTGVQLQEMSDQELLSKVDKIAVYARVSPSDKIRIVKMWQQKGKIVAMTGDGVNDAPALKAADIGCAMGITGTDVAKGAADMTLTDDNFATIVEAVREGRGIYNNIKKVVGFLLGTNIGEVFTVFFAMLLWRETPLLSMQLLWINLVTDSLPAIALGMEPVEADVMDKKPRPKDESVFAEGLGIKVVLMGLLFAIITLIGFYIGKAMLGVDAGRTMAFIVLALCQVVHVFNMRSEHSLFKIGFFTNKKLVLAGLGSFVLMTLVVLIPPVAEAFSLTSLPWNLYLVSLGLSFIPLPVMEFAKLIKHIFMKKENA